MSDLPDSVAWNKKANRYQRVLPDGKLGSFISRKDVMEVNLQSLEKYRGDLQTLTKLMTTGKMSLRAWEESSARTIKDLAIVSYAIGKGGIDRMSANDYLAVARYLKGEYQYLRNFAKDIASGKLSAAQIQDRISRYGKRANKAPFDYAEQQNQIDAGALWSKRNLHPGDNCEDCIGYANQGWQILGVLPLPTMRCQCGANCNCTLSYSKSVSVPK